MPRHKMIICAAALLVCGLMNCPSASADVLGDSTLTGYTFMGGGIAYTSDSGKDYILAQPLYYDYGGDNYYGYGWVKFDVGTETVDQAYLVIDLLGVGSMSATPATTAAPAMLDVYDPGSIDVDDLGGDPALRATLQSNLYGTTPLVDGYTMTANGAYSIDITDIYNSWVNGTDNNGLVLSTPDGGANAGKYAGIGSTQGAAPYISSTAVPEPSTLLLLAIGAGAIAMWRKSKKA